MNINCLKYFELDKGIDTNRHTYTHSHSSIHILLTAASPSPSSSASSLSLSVSVSVSVSAAVLLSHADRQIVRVLPSLLLLLVLRSFVCRSHHRQRQQHQQQQQQQPAQFLGHFVCVIRRCRRRFRCRDVCITYVHLIYLLFLLFFCLTFAQSNWKAHTTVTNFIQSATSTQTRPVRARTADSTHSLSRLRSLWRSLSLC